MAPPENRLVFGWKLPMNSHKKGENISSNLRITEA